MSTGVCKHRSETAAAGPGPTRSTDWRTEMITEERAGPDNLVLRVETLEDLGIAWEKMKADPTIVVDGPAEILEAAGIPPGE